MATTLKDVRKLATELGATVEDDKSGNCHCCRVEAPHQQKVIIMRLYYIDAGHTHFFATLDEAKKAAREAAADGGGDVTVDRCDIPDNKAAIIALANGVTGTSAPVYVAKAKK